MENYAEISTDKIEVNQNDNPRTEMENSKCKIEHLAENIEKNFLLNPVTVEKTGEDTYKIIAGYRRLQAFKDLHIKNKNKEGYDNRYATIPAIVRESVEDKVFVALSENLARKDMTEDEKAKGIYKYKEETNDTVRKIAYKLGISKSYVDKLYQRGKELVNPVPVSSAESSSVENKFEPERLKEIMDSTVSTVYKLRNFSAIDAEDKIKLKQESNKIVRDLQNLIAYLRENEKRISKDDEVKKVLRKQKKDDELK